MPPHIPLPPARRGMVYSVGERMNMPTAPKVPRELAWRIKQEYEERDARGNRVWSQMALAAKYLLSETTVYRAINGFGAYALKPLPAIRPPDQMDRDAAASQIKMMKSMDLKIPPALLARAEGREMTMTEKMAQAILDEKAKDPDQLLDELKGA